jgi:hypothetical protein
VRGRDGCSEAAADQDDQGSRELGGETLDRCDPYLADILSDGAYDAPAPIMVPNPIAKTAVTTTQNGTPADLARPNSAMSTRVITPMVFCPSLEPYAKDTAAPERIVIQRNVF